MLTQDFFSLLSNYSKEKHLQSIPVNKENLMDNLKFIYDPEWEENLQKKPYEILTQILDCYYCLPERPDLASLFGWQAINSTYNELLMQDTSVKRPTDKQGIEKLIREIYRNIEKYREYLEPYYQRLPIKAYRFVATYVLKGHVFEKQEFDKKFFTQSFVSFRLRFKALYGRIEDTYGDILFKASKPELKNNRAVLNAERSRFDGLVSGLADRFKELMVKKSTTFKMQDGTLKKVEFNEEDQLFFAINCILYASRCNNFHGHAASRMNSENADDKTFTMYTNLFLLEYMILGISLHIQGKLSDRSLEELKENQKLLY